MKLICIEEHAVDLDIAKASLPALLKEAPYMKDWATTRPSVLQAQALGLDLGEGRLAEMDKQGVTMQVMSYAALPQLAPSDQAVSLTRAANDRMARACQQHPERLKGFAILPWQDVPAAVDELTHAINELGFNGAFIAGRPGETFLDDPQYIPVLEKLAELKAPLYIHPFHPSLQVQQVYYDRLPPQIAADFSLGGWGWHHEAGIQVVRLILAGVFEKLPDLQVISGHWGEMVPFFLRRLEMVLPTEMTGHSKGIIETYRNNVWVTPSGMYDLPHFEFVHKEVGVDRIIWSTDYPYVSMDGTLAFLRSLPISEDDREKLAYRNAATLFRL